MNEMTDLKSKQVAMHKDFFDRCQFAIDNHFYIEALLMEYAAIESRLEALCGIVGFPCGQKCENRRDIKISSRITCLNYYWNHNKDVTNKSKLPECFFSPKGILKKWITKRDCIVHGLYKNAREYQKRMDESRKLAVDGLQYARLLYNETKRIKRLLTNHGDVFDNVILQCRNSKCRAYQE